MKPFVNEHHPRIFHFRLNRGIEKEEATLPIILNSVSIPDCGNVLRDSISLDVCLNVWIEMPNEV